MIMSAKFQKYLTSFSVSSSFDLTCLENKLQELIWLSSVFKNSFHNLGPLKEREYLALLKEHFIKLKLLSENISLNINGAT